MKLIISVWIVLCFMFGWIASSYACDKNVLKVSVGNPAPCEGWHVSPNQMQKFHKAMEQKPVQVDINKVNEQLLKLSEVEIEYYKQKNKSQVKELDKAETRRFWSNVGMFTLGVVLTGVAAKAAIESSK